MERTFRREIGIAQRRSSIPGRLVSNFVGRSCIASSARYSSYARRSAERLFAGSGAQQANNSYCEPRSDSRAISCYQIGRRRRNRIVRRFRCMADAAETTGDVEISPDLAALAMTDPDGRRTALTAEK